MISHRHLRLRLRYRTLAAIAVVFITLFFLLPRQFAQIPSPAQTGLASACSGTFAGVWRYNFGLNSPQPSGTLTISVQGDFAEGLYAVGNVRRRFEGKITGLTLTGEWRTEQKGEDGTFDAYLSPNWEELVITFVYQQSQLDKSSWGCPTSQAQPSPSPSPQGNPVDFLSGIFGPLPKDHGLSSAHDLDQFKSFDALPKAEQEKLLTRRGPRLQVEYNASDFSMRVLVKANWPILLEYGLESNRPADLSIAVEGIDPYRIQLAPAGHERLSIILPDEFGAAFQVGKLHIGAVTSNGQAADFQLFGFAMGPKGIQALRRVNDSGAEAQLALNDVTPRPESGYEPLALFAPAPQSGTSIQINVSLPNTIKVKQKPENRIPFSFTSREDFSEGRWEWWLLRGLNWKKVWQKETGGISRNQTRSTSWNGIITSRKLVSTGSHGLQLTAWQKAGNNRDWVVARTPSRLLVVK